MSENAREMSHEEIVELQEKFSEIKSTINNVLAVVMALSEMSQRRPDHSEKLASTVLTKAPLIVSRLQEFTQALNEKAARSPQIVSSLREFTPASNEKAPRSISSRLRLSLSRLARRRPAGQSQKIEKEITILNRMGLDAIPAAMFVRIACRFRSEVWVEKEGEQINGKSIMGLMMLAAGQGSKLHIRCEGPDADRAMQELEELIKNRFNEDSWESASQPREQGPTSLQKKFAGIKHGVLNALAVMMARSEYEQRHGYKKLASTVLTKAPEIVSGLQEFTKALNEKAGTNPEAGPPDWESRMSLASLLSADQIIPEMKATEHWSAIVELIDLLESLGRIETGDRESILASLKQRQEEMSTGIGFGVALPHASSDRIEEVVAAFGRSSQGIDFDALDNAPVKFVVLYIVPKNQRQTHLRSLASIAKFLNDRSVRESLATAESADEIFAIFRDRPDRDAR
jgi:phosphotransferase system HPr (HPr) family protein